jgi:hypothetical protein
LHIVKDVVGIYFTIDVFLSILVFLYNYTDYTLAANVDIFWEAPWQVWNHHKITFQRIEELYDSLDALVKYPSITANKNITCIE